jgi:hypothetical protein
MQYHKNKDIGILLYQGYPAPLDGKSATKATEVVFSSIPPHICRNGKLGLSYVVFSFVL